MSYDLAEDWRVGRLSADEFVRTRMPDGLTKKGGRFFNGSKFFVYWPLSDRDQKKFHEKRVNVSGPVTLIKILRAVEQLAATVMSREQLHDVKIRTLLLERKGANRVFVTLVA